MTRTEESVMTRTVSKATQSGWELTFTHESGTSKIVSCNGTNGSGGSLNASIGTSPAMPGPNGPGAESVNSNFNFYGANHDSVLAKSIMDEMKLILNPVV